MMKREQILCDRCCREIADAGSGRTNARIVVLAEGTERDCWEYADLCDPCYRTLIVALDKYSKGYSKKRAKLIGGDTPEPTE